MFTALPLDEIYPSTNFITIASIVLEISSGQNLKYESKQRAITQKLSQQELRFMCTALPFDEIYPLMKFQNHSLFSFGDMLRTKHKYKNKNKGQ